MPCMGASFQRSANAEEGVLTMKAAKNDTPGVFRQVVTRWSSLLPAAALVAGCGGAAGIEGSNEELSSASQALTEDVLADAFATFTQSLVNFGFDQNFSIGYAFHPGLSIEKIAGPQGQPKGSATIN